MTILRYIMLYERHKDDHEEFGKLRSFIFGTRTVQFFH